MPSLQDAKMTGPLQPKGDSPHPERDNPASSQSSSEELSFDDVIHKEAQDALSKAGLDAHKIDKSSQSLSLPEISGFAPASLSPGQSFIQLRKSEFTSSSDKPLREVLGLVNKFLKDCPAVADESLLPAEQREQQRCREALPDSQNGSEALNKSLYLARFYQHLRYIEEAKKATLLSLGIDPDNYSARELLKDLERMHSSEIGTQPQLAIPATLSKSNLRQRIKQLGTGKVIVLGDLLIDELLEGKPERISREAPVLIMEHVRTELIPGGAANAANNVVALGGKCHAIGVCGEDEYAFKMARLFDRCGISHSLVPDTSRPTTVKTRVLSQAHSFRQQILRLDRISHEPISGLIENAIETSLRNVASEYAAIILSDYRGGVITEAVIKSCQTVAEQHKLLVIVDAQEEFTRFQNVSLLTPNQPDAEKVLGFKIDNKQALEKAGKQIMLLTGSQALLITRGAAGMCLFEKGKDPVELPVFNKSEVFDVTGAGDTVVATMALSLVSGASYVEAMALGNLAAGIVVKKPGTAVTSQQEMLATLETLDLPE